MVHPGFFKALKKQHSDPSARLSPLSPSSPAAVSSSVFRCWQKTIWDRVSFHFTHLPHQWEWLFSPYTHTHHTRPSHPLIYCQHGSLSWQSPSCDVSSLMCMTLLSVKLCFTINKTGLSMLKYRKWVGERVKYERNEIIGKMRKKSLFQYSLLFPDSMHIKHSKSMQIFSFYNHHD